MEGTVVGSDSSDPEARIENHYLNITPGDGCYSALLQANDPAMFTNGYHLAVPGPTYTPIDQGHDRDPSPYDSVPLEDLDGVQRPQGQCTDMGAYEASQ